MTTPFDRPVPIRPSDGEAGVNRHPAPDSIETSIKELKIHVRTLDLDEWTVMTRFIVRKIGSRATIYHDDHLTLSISCSRLTPTLLTYNYDLKGEDISIGGSCGHTLDLYYNMRREVEALKLRPAQRTADLFRNK